MKKILVAGSTNTDMVIQSPKFPSPGETILGGKFLMVPGGKGANQAVAAARLGGNVTFISKTGDDIFGKQALENFKRHRINTKYIFTDPENPSGVALITVDSHGENTIVVAPGSNGTLDITDVQKAYDEIKAADLILLQLEIPLETVIYIAKTCFENHKKIILNPAPAQLLPDKLLSYLYILTPNETEAEILTGIKITDDASTKKAAEKLREKGVECVVITLGAKGVFYLNRESSGFIPAPAVKPVDTTAAGDVFNGAFTVALSEGLPIEEALKFAVKAASISVTRLGAQSSIPSRSEVEL